MHRAIKKIPLTFVLPILLAVGILTLSGVVFYTHNTEIKKEAESAAAKKIVLADSQILGKAAVIFDPTTGEILYAKNADVTLPLASLTKLMTAQVVLSNLATTTLITLSKKDLSVEGDAGDWNLKVGDTMTLGNIMKLGLNASSNHAMSAAAAALGSEYIDDLNKTANELGLTHSYFLNSTGLDLSTETSGGYGSASDVAHLAAAFMHDFPTYFEQSTAQSVTVPVSGRLVTVDATALPLLNIPGLIGVKTGYTDLAGGNLVAAFDVAINHPLIAVVLGSTQQGRFVDMRTLINSARESQ